MAATRLVPVATALALLLSAGRAEAAWVQWTGPGATGHWYRLVQDSQQDWNQARSAAQALGGDLVTIASAAEQTFIVSALFGGVADPVAKTVNTPGLIGSWWIGATDAATEGTWTWVTGETWFFTNWGEGQPDNNSASPFGDSGGEDYAQLVWRNGWSSALPGGWNDARLAGYMGLTNFPHLDLKGYIVERTTDPNPVPAPPAMALFVVGLLGLAAVRLRRA